VEIPLTRSLRWRSGFDLSPPEAFAQMLNDDSLCDNGEIRDG
jgi:hypothetical protein